MPTRVNLGAREVSADRNRQLARTLAVAFFFLSLAVSAQTRADVSVGVVEGVDVRDEIHCLALTIYFEARGEPDSGRLAVAHVAMNRAANPAFPDTVCEVVREGGQEIRYGCQFTFWCDGNSTEPSNREVWREILGLARIVYWGALEDPTGGALWYHATYVTPEWRTRFKQGPQIGEHIFYRPVQDLPPKPGRAPQLAENP